MKTQSRIEARFNQLKKENKKALISFVTCGDPDLETTFSLVLEMEKAGSSIIELGIPYSDPLADGEVIQRASARALESGTHIDNCLNLVKRLRKVTQVPLVFLVYFNPVFKYGVEKFLNKCIEVGLDGLIIPDLPLEEKKPIVNVISGKPLNLIPLVTPTSGDRIKDIVKDAQGFIYCVSSKGVTGKRNSFDDHLKDLIQDIKKYTDVPTAIGFGISSREAVENLKSISDGLIVGSAIVEQIEKGLDDYTVQKRVFDFVHDLYKGIEK